ncbi:MAG TPA: bifunctional 2-polyprenyl-6-hydroxyphenol methylase/3-demethylubiquinol 3-O-methyltransferase UbiG [Steroidobacter sp.]|jgi:2-polyprenyl-6-hydroxyphenyl methylase/3-demethylubiquinone-9 3-methyltransferase|nr:bifunctional 2-polyprenyl-6-hydroxyphenol methylase/3-demethylubiquinol 3-O-methyltransferase UbiG [Steroidobacteraceae bacterium]HLS82064.1 bifunctional 2-polyprenyl-6-hydroxyphenol methylase/3-demethylubiquinol 3-O-methyltransferase UbiG [Steroidobacter sp.]
MTIESTPTRNAATPAASNHDPAEIARFDAVAQRWWDPQGEFRPLHALNPVRLQYVERCAGLAGKRVLDVGCGGGLLSEAMARRGAQVTGLDLAPLTIEVAELHALESGVDVRYLRESPEMHAAHSAGAYDVVTCMEMLEHVPEPQRVLRDLHMLVKPGGDIFVSTLNRNLKSWLLAVVGAEYVLNLLARGTHTYERFIKPSELARWARAAGLSVQDVAGVAYDPLQNTARLSANVDVNYMMWLRREGATSDS